MNIKKKNIAIIDYGVGNLYSLKKALDNFGNNVFITEEAEKILLADAIILPGVGSFEAGMKGLRVRNLVDVIKQYANNGKPILGICLGAQLLLDKGYEFGSFDGLGIIPGKVVKFPKLKKERVPHIGWNGIFPVKNSKWDKTILNTTKPNSDVYFVHSFVLQPDKKDDILAMASYGDYQFCSAVRRGNIYGCQFHPEKSGEIGLNIINNFIKLCHK